MKPDEKPGKQAPLKRGRTRVPYFKVKIRGPQISWREHYERQYPNDPEKVQQLLNQSELYEGF